MHADDTELLQQLNRDYVRSVQDSDVRRFDAILAPDFVNRNPAMKVANLLDILKITKQSLARVLKQLIDEGFVIQRAGDEDRRERRLFVSAKGARLTDKLTEIQVKRIEAALRKAGPGAESLAQKFLFAMIAEKDLPQVESLIKIDRNGNHANGIMVSK